MMPEKSHVHAFPTCELPTEILHLPGADTAVPISFAHCRPSKSSVNTLMASGYMLGLAPSTALSQTTAPSLLKQLLDEQLIERPVWSIMLINGYQGVFSLGGTGADIVQAVERETKEQLERYDALEGHWSAKNKSKRESGDGHVRQATSRWEEKWRWSKVQGAEGWWQILMQGVWVEGSMVLRNQPAIIDVSLARSLGGPNLTMSVRSSSIRPSSWLRLTQPGHSTPRSRDRACWHRHTNSSTRIHASTRLV